MAVSRSDQSRGRRWLLATLGATAGAGLVAACAGADDGSAPPADRAVAPSIAAGTDVTFPDVIAATAERSGDGTWTVSATVSSPYDSAERYADAWRVVGPNGEVYAMRELLHDHADEQPFTRSQTGIELPDEVAVVTVEGRDQVSGWGGARVEIELER